MEPWQVWQGSLARPGKGCMSLCSNDIEAESPKMKRRGKVDLRTFWQREEHVPNRACCRNGRCPVSGARAQALKGKVRTWNFTSGQ